MNDDITATKYSYLFNTGSSAFENYVNRSNNNVDIVLLVLKIYRKLQYYCELKI